MVKIRWLCRLSLARLKTLLREKTRDARYMFLTLCYNVHVDKYYVADTAMEPLFWVVDHFTKFFGPIFVLVVCLLTSSAVIIAYALGIPFWWDRNPTLLFGLFIFGHWLLINIVFHYYMAACTLPGFLPQGVLIPEAVSICKKCISPKPPRTHHCSICNRCILKMDHHCPWLNNCIGYFNHRYFFLFMVYMVTGVIFIITFGYPMVKEDLWPEETATPFYSNSTLLTVLLSTHKEHRTLISWMKDQYWYHMCLMYLTFLCFGVLITLGSLTVWHSRLISRGETSIEALINKSEVKRLKKEGKVFINPYDFGSKENWRLFLGLQNGRNWRHVLFPSRHKPDGKGLQFTSVYHTFDVSNC